MSVQFGDWFQKIKENFRQLSSNGRKLLWSAFLFALAMPMTSLFTNFFLWHQQQDIILLILFNLGVFLAMSLGFFCNGFLLRYISVVKLYFCSALLQGIAPMVLIFFNTVDPWQVFGVGLFLGCAAGFFWGNRNLVTAYITKSEDRLHFISLEILVMTLAAILAPFVTGWVLVLGQHLNGYAVTFGYQIMSAIALVVLLGAGAAVLKLEISFPKKAPILLKKPMRLWPAQRWLEMTCGIENSWSIVVPLILTFLFLGKESTAGMVNSSLALISAIVLYCTIHWKTKKVRLVMIGLWVWGSLLATILLCYSMSLVGVLIYFAIIAAVGGFYSTGIMSLLYDVIDLDRSQRQYAYLTDRELFLCLGRVTGLIVFLILHSLVPHQALVYFIVARMVMRIAIYYQAQYIHNRITTNAVAKTPQLAWVTVKATDD